MPLNGNGLNLQNRKNTGRLTKKGIFVDKGCPNVENKYRVNGEKIGLG